MKIVLDCAVTGFTAICQRVHHFRTPGTRCILGKFWGHCVVYCSHFGGFVVSLSQRSCPPFRVNYLPRRLTLQLALHVGLTVIFCYKIARIQLYAAEAEHV